MFMSVPLYRSCIQLTYVVNNFDFENPVPTHTHTYVQGQTFQSRLPKTVDV